MKAILNQARRMDWLTFLCGWAILFFGLIFAWIGPLDSNPWLFALGLTFLVLSLPTIYMGWIGG